MGQMEDGTTFNIASQLTWISVLYETVNETLLLPLAFILGSVINETERLKQRIAITLTVFVAVYLIITLVMLVFTPSAVGFMQQTSSLTALTVQYIRFEAVAIFFSSVFSYYQLLLVLENRQKLLYLLLFLQTVLIIILDSFLVSSLPFSLQLGVLGVALSNIAVNIFMCSLTVYFIYRRGIGFSDLQFNGAAWIKKWRELMLMSGLESGIRNIIFIVMILKMINLAESSGDFWLMNQFIWGWLLLPVFAITQLVRQDAATHTELSPSKISAYLVLVSGVIICWFFTMPFWEYFIHSVMGISHAEKIVSMVVWMLGFYMLFAWNSVFDQYFYGTGRIHLILYQTLIINLFFYGTAYILHVMNMFSVTLDNILLIFGLSLMFDSLLTYFQYMGVRKQNQLRGLKCANL